MKNNIILTLSILALTLGFVGCGAPAANVNVNVKPANANAAASTPASTPASSNANTEKSDNASNADLDFTLVNKTGYDIKEVLVGPSATKDWSPDMEILKGKLFKDGATMDVKFHPKATAENWDIKVEWADGSPSEEWIKLNLTKIEKVTLKYDKATDKTTAVIE